MMSKLLALGLGLTLGLAPAFATDNKVEQSSDRSKNPITGTVTETDEAKVKTTDPATGKEYNETYSKQRKLKKNGEVETEVDQDKKAE